MGKGREVVFSQSNSHCRVRCNLVFRDVRQGLALCRIIKAFEASVERMEKKQGVRHG